jgi:protein tyrosine kinase modulator
LLLSATYSSSHPDIVALKRKIKALEKSASAANGRTDVGAASETQTTADAANGKPLSLDALQTKRLSLKDELTSATQKLSAARLGESLERGQHSERLEVIEQPTLPHKPVSPNRPKLFVVVVIAALMAGGGLAFAGEMLDQSVYRKADLYSLVDHHLIVSIPYIRTNGEVRRRKIIIFTTSALLSVSVVCALVAIIFLLPPPDILFQKVMMKLFG